jgi:hypothetical protein
MNRFPFALSVIGTDIRAFAFALASELEDRAVSPDEIHGVVLCATSEFGVVATYRPNLTAAALNAEIASIDIDATINAIGT